MENRIDTTTIAGRYASVRFAAGLSKKAFAEALGIHPVVSGDIELGKRDPSRDVLVRLASVYAVDINWLLTGHRAVLEQNAASGGLTGASDGSRGDFAQGDFVEIDFIRQEAAAGRGAEIEENAETVRLPVLRSFIAPRKSEKIRAVEVRGDSMTGIGLDDRDIVLFAPEERSGDGVHVISIGTQLLVKRLHFDAAGKSVQVISENPQYAPRILSLDDLDQFRVEGRVIGWMHRHQL